VHGSCFVVERRVDPSVLYGHMPVGDFASRLADAAAEAPIVAGGAPARPPFVFFDLETTGLSGGAGTHAFLVGCASFDADGGFVTRQYLMTRYADEQPLLATVAGELSRAGALVSFNGKSFDAPVIETRYLFHRFEWAAGRLPHLDVLHPARRFWGSRWEDVGRAFQTRLDRGPERAALHDHSSCSLIALEQQVLGMRRIGDVPGFQIPARYFEFVRSGDARPLAAVLEHNRLDLLSLAGLTTRLLHLVRAGSAEARDPREAFALGCVYTRAGIEGRARAAYERAASVSIGAPSVLTAASTAAIRIAALRALAIMARRARRYEEAAGFWRQLIDLRGCPEPIAREAAEALAVHHEHRLRDLGTAKTFALRLSRLENRLRPAWTDAVRHRLARIERKLANAPPVRASSTWLPLQPSSGSPTSARRTSS
jgi:hypothetical protein